MNEKQQALIDLELYWCERMTSLFESNQIGSVDALFSEFVIDDYEPFLNKDDDDWVFIPYHETINKDKTKGK